MCFFFFFKQKTAYEIYQCDWSSDVCSSDLEAFELFLNNKYDEALQKLTKFDDKYEEDVFVLKGDIYLGMDNFADAKITFEKILQVNPKAVSALIGLGECFYKKGLKHDAKTMYEYALNIDKNNEFALLGLAKINQDLGLSPIHNFIGFFSNSEVGEELNSKIETAYLFFEEKEFENSIASLNEALHILAEVEDENKNEVISTINNLLGFNRLAEKNIDKAKAAFEASLKINEDSSQACAGLGEVFYLQNNDKEAKTMFEWAVKNNSLNAFAITGLAKVNKSLGLPANHSTLVFGLSSSQNKKAASLALLTALKFYIQFFDAYPHFSYKLYLIICSSRLLFYFIQRHHQRRHIHLTCNGLNNFPHIRIGIQY